MAPMIGDRMSRLNGAKFNPKEPLNKSAAALGGSFAATFRFENLEIHKVFLRFSNLNLRQNLSPTALADLFRASLTQTFGKPTMPTANLILLQNCKSH